MIGQVKILQHIAKGLLLGLHELTYIPFSFSKALNFQNGL